MRLISHRVSAIFFTIFAWILSANLLNAQTDIAGNLNGTLTLQNSPYVVTGDITIPEGETLELDAGVVIKLNPGTDIFVRGTLLAIGSSANPIYLTSIRDDDPAGDTNGDGSATVPAIGDWGRVEIAESSGNSSIMEFCIVRFGGGSFAQIRVVDSSPTIRNCVIDSSRFVAGLSMEGEGSSVVTNNSFNGNAVSAVQLGPNVRASFSGNTASNNGINGIKVNGGTILRSIYWNAIDMPYVVTTDLYVGDTDSNTPAIGLSLRPGAVVKLSQRNIFVRDSLRADGTPDSMIVFTSFQDDSYGGDTNNDGDASQPAVGQWGRIEFLESTGSTGLFDYCVVRYGGSSFAQIRVRDSSPAIRNCMIDGSRFVAGLSMEGEGSPIVTDNSFNGNSVSAVEMGANVRARFSGNTASNNGINGIKVNGGTILRSIYWNAIDLPYVITSDLYVGDSDTNTPTIGLTLRPGAVVKSIQRDIIVRDSLRAGGTPDSLVVFTSFQDDSYGGDTNNDGDASQPAVGQWGRIEFLESTGSSGLLAYCVVRYGGDAYAQIRVRNASPIIRNCMIDSSRFVAGLSLDGEGDPVITGNSFHGNNVAALELGPNVRASFSGNIAFGNGINGIKVNGGTITRAMYWNSIDLPYVITTDLYVGDTDGNTPAIGLTVRPGAVVKLAQRDIIVRDSLRAAGTADSMIVFTSFQDDSYGGDSNNDADLSVPSVGQWGRIEFMDSSGSSGFLGHCIVRYGGDAYAQIRVVNSSPTIRNCMIDGSRFVAGLSLEGEGDPVITGNSFNGNPVAAIELGPNVQGYFAGNSASGNGINGIKVLGGTILRSLRWNAIDLPYVITSDLSVGDTDVNSPAIGLTIRPGAVIKLNARSILVRDSLKAVGKSDSLIVFTSFHDDAYLGDTNNNQDTSTPAPGNWGRIEFQTSSQNSGQVAYCLFAFGGSSTGMLRATGGSPQITNTTFESAYRAGVAFETGSEAVFAWNLIRDSSLEGILSSGSSPAIHNNTVFSNGRDGVAVSSNSGAEVKNNIVAVNGRYGLNCDGNSLEASRNTYNDIWNNGSADFQGCEPGEGDISMDPLFVDSDNYDFSILSISPAVDAGDPSETDPGSVSRIDMGAFPFYAPPGLPVRVTHFSGTGQTWYATKSLAEPLIVEVTDVLQEPVEFVKVVFQPISGGGSVSPDSIETDFRGRAEATWTLGDSVGEQTLGAWAYSAQGNLITGSPVVFIANSDSLPPAPTVAFSADKTAGFAPLRVQFTSNISNVVSDLLWQFGDGDSSTAENPMHTYQDPGTYTVSLKAWGPGGEDELVQSDMVVAELRVFGSVSGTVHDYDGQDPVAGVRLLVDGVTIKDTLTDNEGSYLLSEIRVGTPYTLQPSAWGWFFDPPYIEYALFNDDYSGQNFSASLYGDVSGNDRIQSFDASILLRYIVGLTDLDNVNRDSIAADVSGDTGLNSFDASLILRRVADLLETFPVEAEPTEKIFAVENSLKNSTLRLEGKIITGGTSFTTSIFMETDAEVYSGDLTLRFDPGIIKPVEVSTGNTTEGFSLAQNVLSSEIKVAIAGTRPATTKGVLVNLKMEALEDVDPARGDDVLAIVEARLNRGENQVRIINEPFSSEIIPTQFYLGQNYPNPFDRQTTVSYHIPNIGSGIQNAGEASEEVNVRLKVYNLLGQEVLNLVDLNQKPGIYEVVLDREQLAGQGLSRGVYFYVIQAGNFRAIKKMIVF